MNNRNDSLWLPYVSPPIQCSIVKFYSLYKVFGWWPPQLQNCINLFVVILYWSQVTRDIVRGNFAPITLPSPVAWTREAFWCDLSSMNLVTWFFTIKPHIWGACQFDWVLLNLVRLQTSITTGYSKHFFRRLKPL